MRSVVIAGGTGMLGRLLAQHLTRRGWRVAVLSRTGEGMEGAEVIRWDGRSPGLWTDALENVHAVINLAGRSVNCRYTAKHRQEMMDSRIASTRVLGEAIAACRCPPRVWLNSSTATIYRHTFGPAHDEISGEIGAVAEAHDAFSIEIATAWEKAFFDAPVPRTRQVAMRTAIVLADVPGNMVRILRTLARLGLGGTMGSGRQYVSWIHERDFCRAVEFLLEADALSGPVNLAAPAPVTNREMMAIVRGLAGVPIGLPAPRLLLEAGAWIMRTETELVLKSRRVVGRKLAEAGFRFEFREMRAALADLLVKSSERRAPPPLPASAPRSA